MHRVLLKKLLIKLLAIVDMDEILGKLLHDWWQCGQNLEMEKLQYSLEEKHLLDQCQRLETH